MRILLADDQPKVCFALRVLLNQRPELQVVGEAGDTHELLAQLGSTQADVVIVDWLLPGLHQAGSLQALRAIRPGLLVIALSGRPELGQAALEAGADDFISKIDSPDHLLATIDRFQERVDNPRQAANLS